MNCDGLNATQWIRRALITAQRDASRPSSWVPPCYIHEACNHIIGIVLTFMNVRPYIHQNNAYIHERKLVHNFYAYIHEYKIIIVLGFMNASSSKRAYIHECKAAI